MSKHRINSDETVREALAAANEIQIVLHRFNEIGAVLVLIVGLKPLYLDRVLSLAGLSPNSLKPVFRYRKGRKMSSVITNWADLGQFPLAIEPLQELSRILGKSIRVCRFGNGARDCEFIYFGTVHPSGQFDSAHTEN